MLLERALHDRKTFKTGLPAQLPGEGIPKLPGADSLKPSHPSQAGVAGLDAAVLFITGPSPDRMCAG